MSSTQAFQATSSSGQSRLNFTMTRRRKVFELGVLVFFGVYALVTLFPFYVLFVRTFVDTKQSTELHLWIPESEALNLNVQIGNLSVYYDLDLLKFKQDMGIPATDYLPARSTLYDLMEEYSIPEEKLLDYFAPYSIYNGWISLLGSGKFWPAVLRTALITVVSIVFLNFLSICTGYGLAGMKRKDQVFWYNLYLLRAVIPPMLVILPQFLVIQWLLNLLPGYGQPGAVRTVGQLASVILLWVRGGALPAMMMTAAIEAIPKELEEAAEVDGANRFQYFLHILLPLLKVPMASVTVIFLPMIWNDFLQPYVFLDQENTTLLPLIQTFAGQFSSNFQVIYTGVFLSALPLIVVYILFRRWFIQGVMAGAIKG